MSRQTREQYYTEEFARLDDFLAEGFAAVRESKALRDAWQAALDSINFKSAAIIVEADATLDEIWQDTRRYDPRDMLNHELRRRDHIRQGFVNEARMILSANAYQRRAIEYHLTEALKSRHQSED